MKSGQTRNDIPWFKETPWLFLLLLYGFGMVWACIFQCEEEELWHFLPATLGEKCHAAAMTWLTWNARIGELASYFVGENFRGWVMVLHPLCLTLAVISLYRLATGAWPDRSHRALGTLFFISLGVLGIHSGLWWFIGNCNWFYPSSFALLFFAVAEHVFFGRFTMSRKEFLALLPLSVIVGMSNESTALPALLFFGGAGVYWKIRAKAKWGASYTVILLALTVAAAVFYGAPAGVARSEFGNWPFTFENILHHSFLVKNNWRGIFFCFWRPLFMGGLLLLWERKINRSLFQPRCVLMLAGILLMWAILIITPCWGAPRSYCPMHLLSVGVLAALFHTKSQQATRMSAGGILLVYSVVMLATIYPTGKLIWSRYTAWTQIEEAAAQAKLRGEDTLVIRGSEIFSRKPVSRLWILPDCIYPFKSGINSFFIRTPVTISANDPGFASRLPMWREGGWNKPQATRLGLKRVIWEYSPPKQGE